MNDELYFNAWSDTRSAASLWKTDGTSNGTTVVKYGLFTRNTDHYGSAVLDGRLYFGGYLQDRNVELWGTDGTSAGTYQVRDIFPGVDEYGHSYSSEPNLLVKNGDFILFGAYYGTNTNSWGDTKYKTGLFKLERNTVTAVPFLQLLLSD